MWWHVVRSSRVVRCSGTVRLRLIFICALAGLLVAGTAHALEPIVEYSLRDGPPPDGSADDIIVPPDTNFARVFVSAVFDAEFYAEFPLAGASVADDVNLALGVSATDISLIHGESKTFRVSVYEGTGTANLDAFGSGSLVESITLPVNGEYAEDVDVTAAWNAAVQNGDAFFGVRVHDPIWTGTAEGAGTIIVGSVVVEGVPEPTAEALAGAAVLSLAVLRRRRR